MNQRKVSARYYLFEDLIWELPGFAALKRTVPIDNLQLYAGYVWAREGAKAPCPVVRTRRAKNDASFYEAPWNGRPGNIRLGGRVAHHRNHRRLLLPP